MPNNSSYPMAILIDKNCPKNHDEIKEIGYEIIGRFDLEKVALDIVVLYICLQKAGIIKLLQKESGGMPAVVCSRFLEIAFQRKDCKKAALLIKSERRTISKMPESIRKILIRKI